MSDVIHQEILFYSTPERIYRALMDSAEHASFTGGPAEISDEVGGAFSCHGGMIQGRNIDLQPNRRIVQAWRPAHWPEGVYSLVRVDLEAEGERTRLTLTHSGIPEDGGEHLSAGWRARYWTPLAKHLA